MYIYRYMHICARVYTRASPMRHVGGCRFVHADAYLLYCNFTRMVIRPGSIVRLTTLCALITYYIISCEVVCGSDFQYVLFFSIYFVYRSIRNLFLYIYVYIYIYIYIFLYLYLFTCASLLRVVRSGCILHKLIVARLA
jgi:hypothetical protein